MQLTPGDAANFLYSTLPFRMIKGVGRLRCRVTGLSSTSIMAMASLP
jgi:hypothetical protein